MYIRWYKFIVFVVSLYRVLVLLRIDRRVKMIGREVDREWGSIVE